MLLLGYETNNRDILQMSLFYTGTFHVLTGTRGLIRNYEISQQTEQRVSSLDLVGTKVRQLGHLQSFPGHAEPGSFGAFPGHRIWKEDPQKGDPIFGKFARETSQIPFFVGF